MAHTDHKNTDIEVLRGVAILITIYAHLRLLFPWSPEWFESSLAYFSPSVGVDLFFCISGYVITSSVIKSKTDDGRFKKFATPFWTRRIWRLWPSAWVWVAINILCAYYFNWSGSFGEAVNTLYSSLAAVTHVANIYFPYCVSHQMCGANMVNWSLSLEEQFYFIFPFLFFFLSRKSLSWFLLIVLLAQFFLFRPTATLLWSIRTDAICSGVLLALHKDNIVKAIDSIMSGLRRIPYLLFVASVLAISMIPATKYGAMSGATTFTCFFFVALAASNVPLIMDGFLKKLLVYIGSRSYAIYLCHEVVFRLINEFYFKANNGEAAGATQLIDFSIIAIAAIFIMAEINYRIIENPLRKFGKVISLRC